MISVLRLGHRHKRDERISTHCGLAARALGAKEIIYSGEHDKSLIQSIKNVSKRWGGSFYITYEKKYKKIIKKYKKKKFLVVHLTMYGLPIQNEIEKLRNRNILLIIGSEKVPFDIYKMADINIAVTNQPHSEVAALSLFLHEYFKGKELNKRFPKAKLKIKPHPCGKIVKEKH